MPGCWRVQPDHWLIFSLLFVAGFQASATAAALPVRADMSLGSIIAEGEAALPAAGSARAAALAHYSTALQFEAAGKLREALEHYLAVFKADPTNAGLAMHTAELAYSFEGREKAIAILESAVEAAPKSPEALLNLARFCATYTSDDPFEKDRATQVLKQALERFPTSARVQGAAVLHHLIRREREAAIQVLEQAAQQPSTAPQFWLGLGRVAQQVWPLGQAETREAHLTRVNPFFDKVLKHARGGKQQEELHLEVAQFFVLTNQLPRAQQICESLAAQFHNIQARKLLFRIYDALEERDKALATIEALVKDQPRDVEQLRLLARAYEEREQFELAVPHLEAAIQIGGGEPGDYLALGDLMLRAQMPEKLVHLSERGRRLFPDQPMFHVQAALAHRSLEHWDKAVAEFALAANLAETTQEDLLNHRFFFQYGITLERAGRIDEAGKIFEKSISLTPKENAEEAATAMNYLGYMWLELDRNIDKAGELILKANELEPNNPAYIDSLGWYHFKKGDFPKALEELQKAASLLKELQPDDAEIIEHIARVHLAMNDLDKARELFQKALALQPTDAKVRKRIEEGLAKIPAP